MKHRTSAPPEVCIAISALGSGCDGIDLPARVFGLEYLVLLQDPSAADPEALAALAARGDTEIVPLEGRGLSNSRNAALEHAEAPLILFADDDQTLFPEAIQKLAGLFATDPTLVLAAGWRKESFAGKSTRSYELSMYNSGRICAPEFMIRRAAVLEAELIFDPAFGVGAEFGIGEDYIFVTDILRAGLKGISAPVITGSHPHPSTGDIWHNTRTLNARREVLKRVFGWRAGFISIAYALKHFKKFSSLGDILRFVFSRVRIY